VRQIASDADGLSPGVTAESVRAQLDRILASPAFIASDALSRFLRFSVEQTLAGHANWLKESVIGIDVFARGKNFDPRLDAIVRVEARRLRTRLTAYYELDGRNDPVVIELHKGSYAPRFYPAGRVTPFSTIAVLPFVNLSTEPDNEYFSDGLTDEIIAALTTVPGLRVIARATAFRYQGKARDIPAIGSELNVQVVLEGSVRKTGNRLRVTAQLIDVSTSFHIWVRTFEGTTKDIVGVQQEISNAIERLVEAQVPIGLQAKALPDPEAYDLYLRGIYFENKRTPEGFERGLNYLRRAADMAPDYAPVFARLSGLLALQAMFGIAAPHDVLPQARAAANRALEIDAMLAEAHAAVALVSAMYDWDWLAAERLFQRALELNPGVPEIYRRYAFYYLIPTGRLDEAVLTVREAKKLDPLSLILNASECAALCWAFRYDAAIECGRRTLELDPTYFLTHVYLTPAFIGKGMLSEALDSARAGVRLSHGSPLSLRQLGMVFAEMGRPDDVLRTIDRLLKQRPTPAAIIGELYGALGDFDTAFRWLEVACRAHSSILIYVPVRPMNPDLRRDIRFKDLVRELGLEPYAAGLALAWQNNPRSASLAD
jgi:TolB-like protein